MLWLCWGHRPVRIDMSSTQRYYPETLINMANEHRTWNTDVKIELNGKYFPLNTPEELELAAQLVAWYHNDYVSTAPEDDYFEEDEEPQCAENSDQDTTDA